MTQDITNAGATAMCNDKPAKTKGEQFQKEVDQLFHGWGPLREKREETEEEESECTTA
jgi:hypothetical protein